MKKITLLLLLTFCSFGFSQVKSTGFVTLTTGFTLKIELDNATSLATITMTGSTNNWLSIGLNGTSMGTATDCFSYNTVLRDQHMCGGYCSPIADTTNNLSTPTVTTAGTTRTITFTRAFNTGDSDDYVFNYASNSLNVIWSIGSSNTNQQHGSKSSKALTFSVLSAPTFDLANSSIYPNPSNGKFTIDSKTTIDNIDVYSQSGKFVKTLEIKDYKSSFEINLQGLSTGVYLLELKNETEKSWKKVIIE